MNYMNAFVYLCLSLICFGCSSSSKPLESKTKVQESEKEKEDKAAEQLRIKSVNRMIDFNRGGRW